MAELDKFLEHFNMDITSLICNLFKFKSTVGERVAKVCDKIQCNGDFTKHDKVFYNQFPHAISQFFLATNPLKESERIFSRVEIMFFNLG